MIREVNVMSVGSTTRKALLCGVAVLAIGAVASGPASAADPASWSGPFIGVDVGYGDMNESGRFLPSETPGDPWGSDSGFVGGVHAGYDMQMDGFVVGVEADMMLTDFDTGACSACVDGSETASAEIDFLGSLRARVGVSMMDNRSLLYATGGVAYRDGKWSASASGLDGKEDFNKFGGVIGAGLEYRASDNVSVRVEGLYYMFSTIDAPPDCCNSTGSDFDSDPLIGRVGISIRF